MTLTVPQSVWVGLGFAVALAGVHLLSPKIETLPVAPVRDMRSFGGGIAAAYVFLYLLPRLAEGNEAIGRVLKDDVGHAPLADLAAFGIVLLGFLVFYALERAARRSPAADSRLVGGVFGLQLAVFALYSALITYTVPIKLQAGVLPATLFAGAMALHLLSTDHVLRDRLPAGLTRARLLALPGGAVGGWLAAVLAAPTSTLLVSLLTAFLGGAVLLNVFIAELPPERHSSLGWFAAGLLTNAALITATTCAASLGAA
jgi:uncharacterized membrane protein YeaQ/YmgE (transglycosylase-associated protein family)